MVRVGLLILEAIRNTYKKNYIGLLKIKKLCPFGYMVSFGLNNRSETPISIALEIEDCENYIKQFILELRICKFHDSRYFSTRLCYESDGLCECVLQVKVLYDNNNCCETDTLLLSVSEVWIPYNKGPQPVEIISLANWHVDDIITWKYTNENIIISKDKYENKIYIDSDSVNTSKDREQIIKIYNDFGYVKLVVHLEGLREMFKIIEGPYVTYKGITFNVIKEKYKNELERL